MPNITISNRRYSVISTKSLLDSLLDQGERLPFSCRSGICHACMLKADSGSPPAKGQQSLKETERKNGYFLACQCFPTEDMAVSRPSRTKTSAVIRNKKALSATLVVLTLVPRHPVGFLPEQLIRVTNSHHLYKEVRLNVSAFSEDQELKIEIERKMGDLFSVWAYETAAVGDLLNLESIQ